jgi:hypothetical protein
MDYQYALGLVDGAIVAIGVCWVVYSTVKLLGLLRFKKQTEKDLDELWDMSCRCKSDREF